VNNNTYTIVEVACSWLAWAIGTAAHYTAFHCPP